MVVRLSYILNDFIKTSIYGRRYGKFIQKGFKRLFNIGHYPPIPTQYSRDLEKVIGSLL